MRPEELTALLRTRPFVPLRIHMTDGHAYDITHPELMMVGRPHAFIGLRPDRETGVVDRTGYFACSTSFVSRVDAS